MVALLPDSPLLYGWNDGGCLLLADALTGLFGSDARIVAVVDDGIAQHFAARVGWWHLDGDGACPEAVLLRRWRRHAGLNEPALVPLDADTPVHIDPDIPRDTRVSARIAAALGVALEAACAPANGQSHA